MTACPQSGGDRHYRSHGNLYWTRPDSVWSDRRLRCHDEFRRQREQRRDSITQGRTNLWFIEAPPASWAVGVEPRQHDSGTGVTVKSADNRGISHSPTRHAYRGDASTKDRCTSYNNDSVVKAQTPDVQSAGRIYIRGPSSQRRRRFSYLITVEQRHHASQGIPRP